MGPLNESNTGEQEDATRTSWASKPPPRNSELTTNRTPLGSVQPISKEIKGAVDAARIVELK